MNPQPPETSALTGAPLSIAVTVVQAGTRIIADTGLPAHCDPSPATVPRVPTLAIDIGGTKTAAALINEDDAFLEHTTWPSPPTAAQAMERITTTAAPLAREASACGVSFGGPFDFARQICIRSMHTDGWDDLPLSQELEQTLGIPVITDNDANVAAFGEYQLQPPTNRDPMLYVTISTGVGAGVIANGQVLRGAHSLAGELGHLSIGHNKECNCGQSGCLERAVSGYWIERDRHQRPEDYLRDETNYDAWLRDLAQGLWAATLLIDPAVIVVGGGMTTQGERLAQPLRAALTSKAHASNRTPPAIKIGDPAGRTVLLGAAIVGREVSRGSRR